MGLFVMNNKIENAIEFVNISKSFGNIKANKNINFSVKKGTIHALIGENGAGKSTLMSILFGLYEPDEGFIKVNDKKNIDFITESGKWPWNWYGSSTF